MFVIRVRNICGIGQKKIQLFKYLSVAGWLNEIRIMQIMIFVNRTIVNSMLVFITQVNKKKVTWIED